MKKIINAARKAGFIALAALVLTAAPAAARAAQAEPTNADGWVVELNAGGPTLLFVNGSLISAKVIIESGRALVPLRVFAETLGAEVLWVPETMAVKVTDSSRIELRIDLRIGDKIATVDDTPFMMSVAPRLVNSVTYVPLRFIAEALGASVAYCDGGGARVVEGTSVNEGYFEGVKHIMVSRYPSGVKAMAKTELIAELARVFFEDSSDAAGDSIGGETDRYYKASVPVKLLIDKYTGNIYAVSYGEDAITTALYSANEL